MKLRDKHTPVRHSSTAVLRDKVLFGMLTDYAGVGSARNIAILENGDSFDTEMKKYSSLECILQKSPSKEFFIKPAGGECGVGIMKVTKDPELNINGKRSSFSELKQLIGNTRYIIQANVSQHPDIAALHPQSLNTIRLVTARNPQTEEIDLFSAVLRVGTGSSFVDNWAQGGLAIGIDIETGILKEWGFYKPGFGTKTNCHPDSKITFDGYTIPHFKEACQQAKLLHSFLPDIRTIGWDIAIGEHGPIFIEGNDNWEITLHQCCCGPLKSAFEKYTK